MGWKNVASSDGCGTLISAFNARVCLLPEVHREPYDMTERYRKSYLATLITRFFKLNIFHNFFFDFLFRIDKRIMRFILRYDNRFNKKNIWAENLKNV